MMERFADFVFFHAHARVSPANLLTCGIMQIKKSEGVIIQITPFQETDCILTAFTPDAGLLSFFVKRGKKRKDIPPAILEPFTHAEFVYLEGQKDLHKLQEASILHLNLGLRNRLESLNTASDMLHAVKSSQITGKASRALFSLFVAFLKAIPHAAFPESLGYAFYLKLLLHEGLIHITPDMDILPAIDLTEDEKSIFLILTGCRASQTIGEITLSTAFAEKIKNYFSSLVT